jgi:hypothetical protein
MDFSPILNSMNIDKIKEFNNKENSNIQEELEDCQEDNIEDQEDILGYENNKTLIFYYEDDEIMNEEVMNKYHLEKNTGSWLYAKMIIQNSYNDKLASEFFWDYLDLQFKANNDAFRNITKVYYKSNLDIDIIYEFNYDIARYIVDNLKIQQYKTPGYIFNNDENNKWPFKIIVVTTKDIYSANRYINENTLGCY